MNAPLVDSHCHLDFPELAENLHDLLAAMAQADVGWALCAGVTLERFPAMLALVRSASNLFAAVGVHPDTEYSERDPDAKTLLELANDPRVVAIGETGLDYYRLEGDLEWQRERFRTHIRAARLCSKPLIIHTRSAAADTLAILKEEGAEAVGGVFHCFTESAQIARTALDLGFYISFSGIVTFKNAIELKEVAKMVPLERMLVETDAPYLAPVPYRGKVNQPAYVRHVAEEIARLRGLTLDAVAEQTTENFFRLFSHAKR
ncbi:TatD family hydrolase [Sulfuricystis multivorans]|uniref:TatD family hydrolase n=1 Tax=Sulfuricystis multivorans TaxID=2211108 RepID=UPI000F831E5F|nr:TatD family hydrolase [Sulfuricystis multivorans]